MRFKVKQKEFRTKREEKGFKKSRLALTAGLSFYSVERLENKGFRTSLLRAKAIAKVLKCKVEDIFEEVV